MSDNSSSNSNTQLEVIGAGFGRTGTESLRQALIHLGYTTHHMIDIIQNNRKEDLDAFYYCLRGDVTVRAMAEAVYEKWGYTAAVDFPTAVFWKELADDVYPNAKIILTERATPDLWWESASTTIMKPDMARRILYVVSPLFGSMKRTFCQIWYHLFGLDKPRLVRPSDKDAAIKAYLANSKVARAYDPNRMLVYDVREGWEPLCKFLGKDVPNIPFPMGNSRSDFGQIWKKKFVRFFLPVLLVSVPVAYFYPRALLVLPLPFLIGWWSSPKVPTEKLD